MTEWISYQEAEERTGFSVRSLRRKVADGDIRTYQPPHVLLDADDVQRLICRASNVHYVTLGDLHPADVELAKTLVKLAQDERRAMDFADVVSATSPAQLARVRRFLYSALTVSGYDDADVLAALADDPQNVLLVEELQADADEEAMRLLSLLDSPDSDLQALLDAVPDVDPLDGYQAA